MYVFNSYRSTNISNKLVVRLFWLNFNYNPYIFPALITLTFQINNNESQLTAIQLDYIRYKHEPSIFILARKKNNANLGNKIFTDTLVIAGCPSIILSHYTWPFFVKKWMWKGPFYPALLISYTYEIKRWKGYKRKCDHNPLLPYLFGITPDSSGGGLTLLPMISFPDLFIL